MCSRSNSNAFIREATIKSNQGNFNLSAWGFKKTITDVRNNCVSTSIYKRFLSQDVHFALIIWYVAKLIPTL